MSALAWLGLGAMGAPMAKVASSAGFRIRGYDPFVDATALGLEAAASPADAADGADCCVVIVATPAQADAALFGTDGATQRLPCGATVILMSTVGPEFAEQCAARLAAHGVGLVDAPVSGGVVRAAEGRLLVMASGEQAPRSHADALLHAVGDPVVVVGDRAGDGQAVKLVNQLLCGVHIAAAAEALAFAEAIGLEPAAVWDIVRHGAAASFMLDDRGARMVAEDFQPPRSALDIFVKDMGLVVDSARRVAFPAPLARAAEQLYLIGRRRGLGTLDDAAVLRVLRDEVGEATQTREAGRSR